MQVIHTEIMVRPFMLKYNFQFLLILKLPCISKGCPGWLNILLIYRFAYIMIKSCLSSLRCLVCGMSQPLEKARKFLLCLYTGCSGRFYWGRGMTNFTSEIHSTSYDKHMKFWVFRVYDIDSFFLKKWCVPKELYNDFIKRGKKS